MAVQGPQVVRVVSYNIHRCIGSDGHVDPDRIVSVLQRLRPDVVALQEVVSASGPEGGMLGYIARKTGLAWVAGLTMLEGDGHYGNGLLTRAEIGTVERFDISWPGREPRGVLAVQLNFGNRSLGVFATHLGLHRRERRFQIEQLLKRMPRRGKVPWVLMGDFNEWNIFSANLRLLRQALGHTPMLATFPAKYPLFSLDKIYLQPARVLQSLQVIRDASTRVASDHLPLLATIALDQAVQGESLHAASSFGTRLLCESESIQSGVCCTVIAYACMATKNSRKNGGELLCERVAWLPWAEYDRKCEGKKK
nr:endonuclease/exonuclease/phosphatase family protein [uncultured Desulfobulbus sp.]